MAERQKKKIADLKKQIECHEGEIVKIMKNKASKPRTDVLLKDIDKEYERFENDIDEVQG